MKVKPWEVALIEKVIDLTDTTFPEEVKEALEIFKERYKSDIELMQSDAEFNRGFQAWFLLQYSLENELTPMEFAFSKSDKLFSEKELRMIEHFLDFKKSLFEIKSISQNKKDYTIQNVIDNKEYLVKTIDFPAVLNVGEFIVACIVKKLDGGYFYYGNVLTYDQTEGLKIKNWILKNIAKEHPKAEEYFWEEGSFAETMSEEEMKEKMKTFHKKHDEDMNFNCKDCSEKISAHNRDWHAGLCDNCFNKLKS